MFTSLAFLPNPTVRYRPAGQAIDPMTGQAAAAPAPGGAPAAAVPPSAYYAWITLSTLSGAASAYHGYKRNNSVGWAVVWYLLGSLFPVVTPVIAVAEGYGQPKSRRRSSR